MGRKFGFGTRITTLVPTKEPDEDSSDGCDDVKWTVASVADLFGRSEADHESVVLRVGGRHHPSSLFLSFSVLLLLSSRGHGGCCW